MTPRASDDSPEHDAWLREALRHAPDAAAGPPAAVSDAILRQARSEMAASTTTAAPSVGAEAPITDYLKLFDYDINLIVSAIKEAGSK